MIVIKQVKNMHVLNLSEIAEFSFENLRDSVLENKSMMIKNLRVFDLVMCGDRIIKTGNGIYIVHSGTGIDYIGKATSRSFVERVPAHFDPREDAWFNTLLKRTKNKESDQYDYSSLSGKYLVLINFDKKEDLAMANGLEAAMRVALSPALNPVSRKRQESRKETLSKKVRDYLK